MWMIEYFAHRHSSIFETNAHNSLQKTWPKSTLDGVKSAISSRKLMYPTMKFQLQRIGSAVASEEVVKAFEIVIPRPMGINIEGKKSHLIVLKLDFHL